MNGTQADFDVIINGLGPTGMTLAHGLGMRGHRVLVLEREPRFYGNARAVYTDGECMRIFQDLGMGELLAADMLQDAAVQMLLPNGKVLLQIKSTKRVYGWPLSNFFYQPYLETTLAEGLSAHPSVTILRGRELTRFEQDDTGVTVYHANSNGSNYGRAGTDAPKQASTTEETTVRARYLVACDGGRSTVRTQLGIKMQGKSFPNPWLVVDVKQKDPRDGLHHLPNFSFVCDPECPTVSCVQPNGHHRFEFMLMPGQSREYMEDPATVHSYLSKWIDVDKFEILRTLVYTFNALMAEKWREGRVFLAGDAAHMTPQFIGQGMNAGVRDAFNLAWKLDAVIRGQAGDRLLDTYQTERRPHAAAMTREGERMKDFVSLVNPLGVLLRNALARVAVRTPGLKTFITEADFIPKATYRQGSYFGLPRRSWRSAEGRMLPQPDARGPDGRRYRLDEFLGRGYALIGAGFDPRDALGRDELAFWQHLDARFISLYPLGGRPQGNVSRRVPDGLVELEDVDTVLLPWIKSRGRGPGSVTIVRPDRFVAAQVEAKELIHATKTLAGQLQ